MFLREEIAKTTSKDVVRLFYGTNASFEKIMPEFSQFQSRSLGVFKTVCANETHARTVMSEGKTDLVSFFI